MAKQLLRVVILGAPGSGKGTISNRILRDFSLSYFSVGDTLREHIKARTDVGVEAKKFIQSGTLVPDATINRLVLGELQSSRFAEKSWLLDGYPRSKGQTEELLEHQELRPSTVVNLVVPDEVIIERIKHRWIHVGSGRIYHTIYNPPKKPGIDDLTGEPLVQRVDDKEETVKARLDAYHAGYKDIVDILK